MPKPKGGRGKAAPYQTRQVRVPEPIINQVDQLIEQYQDCIASGGDSKHPPSFIQGENKPVDKFIDIEQIVNILQEALKLKANAGGAIKKKIKEVLNVLKTQEFSE